MPRLLHTADWQIGHAYMCLPPEAAVPLMAARLAALASLGRPESAR